MKTIKQESVETAFEIGAATNVVVIQRSAREWYFTFDAEDPVSGKTETFALLTQRGQLRLWADPRTLFAFLKERFNVLQGTFQLVEETQHEKPG
ncbi:MAG: KorA protein [Methylomonas sp.]|nr:MAG: KorA protein [Methylomonas sp.]